MKSKPILFSTPMVKAILSGKKTQTRRIVKGLTDDDNLPNDEKIRQFLLATCPYGQKNDELWVRETWAKSEEKYHYAASVCNPKYDKLDSGWKPSIFMPRVASRITLNVERVELQRLYEISEADAIAEGVTITKGLLSKIKLYQSHEPWAKMEAAQLAYLRLWGEIHGNTSVYENPWVWVIHFNIKEVRDNAD